jgi:Xaa-Pro aminopeptidase
MWTAGRRSSTGAEIAWVDAYHARVREVLGPLVDDTALWLAAATQPIRPAGI